MHGVQTSNPQAVLTTDYTDEYRILYTIGQRSAISGRGTLRRDLRKVAGSSRSHGSKTRELEAPTTLTSAFRPLPRPISGLYLCNLWSRLRSSEKGTTKRAPPIWFVSVFGLYLCNLCYLWLKRIGWIDSGKLHSVHSV